MGAERRKNGKPGDLMTKKNIAVIGSGISGVSAAWLLAKTNNVTLYEAEKRFGGHAHTENLGFDGSVVPVDVGFIVFNEKTYPNFTQLLKTIGVESNETEMGFSVSLENGAVEYAGGSFAQLVGTASAAFSSTHWSMLKDISRFYRTAVALAGNIDDSMSLGRFLKTYRFGTPFIERHLLPMAAAIWSSPPGQMLDYPAKAFIAFFDNHQLLNIGKRDKWRSIAGGSKRYVERMLATGMVLHGGDPVVSVSRGRDGISIRCLSGHMRRFDDIVIATHADQALAMLADASDQERMLLSPFQYSANKIVVHRDPRLMPRTRRNWSSWNYVGSEDGGCGVTYWMNRLQQLGTQTNYFVSLNPATKPDPALVDLALDCTHPVFNNATLNAQKKLWDLQGQRNTWFCGAYFGAGFHEDGLQAGLAVAEQLGGVKRPWSVPNPSNRIFVGRPGSEGQAMVGRTV
jgi:hypothetical protein